MFLNINFLFNTNEKLNYGVNNIKVVTQIEKKILSHLAIPVVIGSCEASAVIAKVFTNGPFAYIDIICFIE